MTDEQKPNHSDEAARARVRGAMRGVSVDPHLGDRVRASLGQQRLFENNWRVMRNPLLAAAATVGMIIVWSSREARGTQACLSALAHHEECFRFHPSSHGAFESTAEGSGAWDRREKRLEAALGKEYELLTPHRCRYKGEEMLHLVVRRNQAYISYFLTPEASKGVIVASAETRMHRIAIGNGFRIVAEKRAVGPDVMRALALASSE